MVPISFNVSVLGNYNLSFFSAMLPGVTSVDRRKYEYINKCWHTVHWVLHSVFFT